MSSSKNNAESILKTFEKDCFKGEKPKIFITVREIRKNILDIKIKEETKSGNMVVRVHTDDEKSPQWFVHGYAIPISNLSINEVSDKKEMFSILNDFTGIMDTETKTLLKKIQNDYGDIMDDGSRNKFSYKTERFKKTKDYFHVKRKTF